MTLTTCVYNSFGSSVISNFIPLLKAAVSSFLIEELGFLFCFRGTWNIVPVGKILKY